MTPRKITSWVVAAIVIGSLAACGSDDKPTVTVPATNSAQSIQSVSTPATISAEESLLPTTYVLEEQPEEEAFPTPDVAKKMAEMEPTAVIVEGAFPYPTANSALDSDGDGAYTLAELEQAVRETYPAWEWPDAYHPTVDELFAIVNFSIFPPESFHEVPAELAWIGNIHKCAWQQNWIDAFGKGDQAEMDMSMRQLRTTVLNNPFNVYVASHYAEIYNLAELGDPAQLLQDQSQCTGFNQWIKNRSATVPRDRDVVTHVRTTTDV